jgi:hypothetical protein
MQTRCGGNQAREPHCTTSGQWAVREKGEIASLAVTTRAMGLDGSMESPMVAAPSYRMFADYVDCVMRDKAIQDYITWLRKAVGWKLSENIQELHGKLEARQKELYQKKTTQ